MHGSFAGIPLYIRALLANTNRFFYWFNPLYDEIRDNPHQKF